ncbi:YjbF family lipoprotein [uncultured Tateyamaria sp.]|uniref:YjbF family lipoprotein n=1 Tax=uncultured Tateyamaria sp. TaxID=455651 RepID=UPI002601601C|nr:YjbF family lipoprotein [uncultured Tateyamaria sp.]
MMRAITCAIVAATLGLAGCTGGNDQSSSQAAQLRTYVDVIRANRGNRGGPAPLPTLTPALISQLTVPSLEVTVENRNTSAFLVPFSERRDSRPGLLRTWRTANDAMLVMRGGVLVATRGLGNDLASSNADAAVTGIQRRSPVSGLHTVYYVDGDNQTRSVDLDCEMRTVGNETVEIVQRGFPTVHLQENCTGTRGIITYDYWVDRRDGVVVQSRQWGGPELGYIRTRRIKK